jgi:prolyl oligopeptidase
MKALVWVLAAGALAAWGAEKTIYPVTRKVDHVDMIHGVAVADPYRWLEDANSAETKKWVAAENAVTMPYLASLPERGPIHQRLTKLFRYERFAGVFKAGDRYFWQRNDGVQDRAVLYVSKGLNSAGEILLDPNQFADKTIALADVSVRKDGRRAAYLLQKAGSDWMEITFADVDAKKELPDRLKWVKFSDATWSEDGSGIYYSRYDEPNDANKLQDLNVNQKLYFHRLGTPQSDDKLIFFRPEQKNWMYAGNETEDGRYLLLRINRGAERVDGWFYRKADGGDWVELLPKFDAEYDFLGNEGSRFFFRTTLNAPKGRVIGIDLNRPKRESWIEIVPESSDSLTSVSYLSGQFFASLLSDARSVVRIYDAKGKSAGELKLPGIGRAFGFAGRQDAKETFYTFQSYTVPSTVYHYDLKSRESKVFKQPEVPADLTAYKTELVFYHSKDGTRVPMFLTYRKDMKRDGTNPVYLYGYGGFNVPVTMTYVPSWMVWLEMGGIVATPGIRGGGEYGREWHMAGTKARKQNVFDDFIAAAEYLAAEKYTNPKKIAIAGGSNGGLLVAACLLQRPDLFGVALPAVGVLDMLRFQKFTIGWGWVSDYGSADNAEDFKALLAYSPYHNVKPGVKYPATLITTADHDDRVVPAHSFKFAAALQAAQAGDAPVLIRIQTEAGHGAGKPQSMLIEEQSDVLAFTAHQLGMTPAFGKRTD